MKVHIATSRRIGLICRQWASKNLPNGWEITNSPLEADVFISVLYDKILREYHLNSKTRYYNFHPGILPEYAGSATLSWSIVSGETEAGVTLHLIDKGVDSGDIIDIQKVKISETETAGSLFTQIERLIDKMFKMWFNNLLEKKYKTTKQDFSRRKNYKRKDLDKLKDLTPVVRALTFDGKESAYFINANGEKIVLNYYGD